ncbi:hypothetical protein MASR1M50_14600 [Burkholderiales bacterium]
MVITGLSGSGKSSLAFDTLYAEGQRRYVESLSSYARQFLQLMDKPDVDLIEGLSPAIAIEQKATSHNPRSTVGTVTEIHDYLRLLFARAGTPHCPDHQLPLSVQTVSQMVDATLALPEDTRVMVLAPLARDRKGEFTEQLAQMQALGYVRFRIDGAIVEADRLPALHKNDKHDIDVVIDRLKVRPDAAARLADSFEAALRLAEGRAIALEMDSGKEHLFNSKFACPVCNHSIAELEPRLFSFNAPAGACPSCDGLGTTDVFDPERVVAFPSLSLASGAIKGWDRRNGYYFALIESLAKHYQFSVDTPFEDLPEAVRRAILHGSGTEEIAFAYTLESGRAPPPGRPKAVPSPGGGREAPQGGRGSAGRKVSKKHPFEGILPNMARRWRETDSAVVREELSRYRSQQPCAGLRRHAPAQGSAPRVRGRWRAAPRHLRDQPRHAGRGQGLVRRPAAARRQGRDRRQGGARDRQPPEVPERRRPELPEPGTQRRHPEWWRGPAHPPGQPDRLGPDGRDVRAGRAQHRPAPARQRPPDRHPQAPAQPGQQRAGGRARRGHDARRRPRDRPGPRRRRARRARDGAGHV